MTSSTQQLIQQLMASKQFQYLLSEQISKQMSTINPSPHLTSLPLQSASPQLPKTMQISDMISQISENLEQIIIFNIRQALEQEYGLLLEDNGKIKSDIEDIREQILKITIKTTNNKHLLDIKPSDLDGEFNDLEEMLQNQSKIGSKQYTKTKKEIESIKLMLLRFTNASSHTILEEVFQTSEKKNKLQERMNKLGKDINQLVLNDTDGQSLKQSIGIESCMKQIQGVIERQKKFQASICDKYETSLKSVWNVITMMENNFEQSRSGVEADSPASKK